jgi:3-isopropylmalate/(R)-2-methylmalate dehydratase small subunit
MGMDPIKGSVWKFGDNVSTDLLMPTFSMFGKVPDEEMKNYCMQAERPEFAQNVKKGDIAVGGKNFGCGSSRPAAKNLLDLGIGCVLAESMGAIFFRNSVNLGLPVLSIEGISEMFDEGDQAEVDLAKGEVRNIRTGKTLKTSPLPEQLMQLLQSGGIVPLLKQEAKEGRLYHRSLD